VEVQVDLDKSPDHRNQVDTGTFQATPMATWIHPKAAEDLPNPQAKWGLAISSYKQTRQHSSVLK
jgi:hypothetical protein